jgi:hypothetical protein
LVGSTDASASLDDERVIGGNSDALEKTLAVSDVHEATARQIVTMGLVLMRTSCVVVRCGSNHRRGEKVLRKA